MLSVRDAPCNCYGGVGFGPRILDADGRAIRQSGPVAWSVNKNLMQLFTIAGLITVLELLPINGPQ
jgi:hypothetical protein